VLVVLELDSLRNKKMIVGLLDIKLKGQLQFLCNVHCTQYHRPMLIELVLHVLTYFHDPSNSRPL